MRVTFLSSRWREDQNSMAVPPPAIGATDMGQLKETDSQFGRAQSPFNSPTQNAM
jgi:hypothetical protein